MALYGVPVILATAWDTIIVFTSHSTAGTIMGMISRAQSISNPTLDIFFELLPLNAMALGRILETDLVLGFGFTIFLIGVGQGFSLSSIFSCIKEALSGGGDKVDKGGIVSTIEQVTILFFWVGIFWIQLRNIWQFFTIDLHIPLPPLNVPDLFLLLYNYFNININLGIFLFSLLYIVVPIYVIFTVVAKLVGAAPLIESVGDQEFGKYFIFLGTALMITLHIYHELLGFYQLVAIPVYKLPIYDILSSSILQFLLKIATNTEAIGFYVGAILIIPSTILKIFGLRIFGLGKAKYM